MHTRSTSLRRSRRVAVAASVLGALALVVAPSASAQGKIKFSTTGQIQAVDGGKIKFNAGADADGGRIKFRG
ncbi:MAG: hypothetical protein U0Q21_08600 [Dermatophilaceae bacterium]